MRREVTRTRCQPAYKRTRKYVRQIRAMLHARSKFGADAAEQEFRSRV